MCKKLVEFGIIRVNLSLRMVMDRKKWKAIVGVVVAAAIVLVGVLVVKIMTSQSAEESTPEVVEQNLDEIYGYTEKAATSDLVAKFNQVVIEQAGWELMPADEGTVTTHDEMYWYPLYEDVALVAVPVEYSGDKAKDVVLSMLVYTDRDSVNRETALRYFRCLIQANDVELGAEEIDGLMTEAETLRERGEMANQGRGIFVAVHEAEDHIEYQVVRNYQED